MKKSYFILILFFLPCIILLSKNADIEHNAYFTPKSPVIDGEIDEVYRHFKKINKFYQFEPYLGKSETEKTIFYYAFDDNNLYLAFKCMDKNAGGIRTSFTKREGFNDNSDSVTVYLDTFRSRRRSFIFSTNAYGIQKDGIRDDESRRNRKDFSWDGLWYSKGKIYKWGYFVEMKIPFKSIRFSESDDSQKWGLIAVRKIARKGEADMSVNMDRSIRGFLTQASTLILNKKIKSRGNIELVPTITGAKTGSDDSFNEFGISAKYGITSNLILDLTYNPDFSQIEADAGKIDINQKYDLKYPEKRPFFLESKGIFEMPINLFYSRRIVDPEWGLKFTGRLGRSTIGILSSRDNVIDEDLDEGQYNSNINLLRYKYKLKDSSFIGFFASNRTTPTGDNLVLSGDSFFKFNNFVLKFQGVYTRSGDSNGNGLNTSFSYNSRKLNLSAGYNQYSPDLDVQLGFLRRISYRTYYIFSGYSFYPEKKFIRKFSPRFMFTQNFDWTTGKLMDTVSRIGFHLNSFKNSRFSVNLSKGMEQYEGINYNKESLKIDYQINLLKEFTFKASYDFGDSINYDEENPYLGYKNALSIRSDLILLDRVSTQLHYINYYFYESKGGNLEQKMNIFRIKNTILFSREISSRFIYEMNDYYETHYLSLLLSYELNPGSAAYLGATLEKVKLDDNYVNGDWSIFFKISYLIRI